MGYPHAIKGEGVYAYVILKDHVEKSTDEIKRELRSTVKEQIASYAVPELMQVGVFIIIHYRINQRFN